MLASPSPHEQRHLESRRGRVQSRSERLSHARVIVFVAGAAIAVTGAVTPSLRAPFSWLALIALFLYVGLVIAHARVKDFALRLDARLGLARRRQAMRDQNWSELPSLSHLPVPERLPPYFGDLDVLSGRSLLRLIHQTVSTAGWLRLIARFDSNGVAPDEVRARRERTREMVRLNLPRRKFLVAARLDATRIDTERLESLSGHSLVGDGWRVPLVGLLMLNALTLGLMVRFALGGFPAYFLLTGFLAWGLQPFVQKRIAVLEAYGFATAVLLSLGKMSRLSVVLERMAHTRKPRLRETLAPFRDERRPSAAIQRIERAAAALGVRQNFAVHLVCHFFVPWDALWTLRLESLRRDLAARLPSWIETFAEIEVVSSIAEYELATPGLCEPIVADGGDVFFEAKGLRHPLLRYGDVVANDIRLTAAERCWIITGSNMAGKSTFLRSVGLNLLLAKAGAATAAQALAFQDMDLSTCLRAIDSLEEGLSTFYAEVKRLRQILDLARSSRASLYLIDEILRGTNNRERLVGSHNYIRTLAATPACGLIATHDLELAQIEKDIPSVANWHFKDDVRDGKMVFSYKIHKGPCTTTNALKILAMEGLPVPGPA